MQVVWMVLEDGAGSVDGGEGSVGVMLEMVRVV